MWGIVVDYSLYWEKDGIQADVHWAKAPARLRPAGRLIDGGDDPPEHATMYQVFAGTMLAFLRGRRLPFAKPYGQTMLMSEIDSGVYLGETNWEAHSGRRSQSRHFAFRDQHGRTSTSVEVSTLLSRTRTRSLGADAGLAAPAAGLELALPVTPELALRAGSNTTIVQGFTPASDPTLRIGIYAPFANVGEYTIENYLRLQAQELAQFLEDQYGEDELYHDLTEHFGSYIDGGRGVGVETSELEVTVDEGDSFEVVIRLFPRSDSRRTLLAIGMSEGEEAIYTSDPILVDWDEAGFLLVQQ